VIGGPSGARAVPSPSLPLAYLITAACAFALAAAGVASLAPELAGHYYHPRIVALAHTITLGWITLAIMGAGYQVIPVVLERPVWSTRLAWWQLGVLIPSIAGMVAHFYLGTWPGLVAAALLVAAGIGMHLVNVGLTVRGATWDLTARLVALGYLSLGLTAAFGVTLGADRLFKILPGDFFPTLHAHVHLAVLGWVAPMMLGVAARVYPLFFLASAPGLWSSRLQLWGLAIGVPALVLGLLGLPSLAAPGAFAVAIAVGAHGVWMMELAIERRRPTLDWGLRFVLTASAFLLPASCLGLAMALDWLSGPRAALAYAVLVLGGWVSLTIVGMSLKIVPFLVWYRVYAPQAGRRPVPTMTQLSWPAAEGIAYALLVGGVALLALAVAHGDAAAIGAAGCALTLGAVAFGAALLRGLRHLAPGPTSRVSSPRNIHMPAERT
jgi:hypothetical protein